MKKIQKLSFYPWALALYSVFYVYSVNVGLVRDEEVPIVLAFSLIITTVLFAFNYFFFRFVPKAAALTAIGQIGFFFFGHLYEIALIQYDLITTTIVAVGITVVLMLLASWVKSERVFITLTAAFNIIFLVLLVVPLFKIAHYWYGVQFKGEMSIPVIYDEPLELVDKIADSPETPDIYYIIADGYPNNRYMLDRMGYDNSAFTDALEKRGFFVAYDSQSSYGATLNSLSATLNMRYYLANESDPHVNDLVYLRALIADSLVMRELLQKGYTCSFWLSGYLLPSPIADINQDFTPNGPVTYDKTDFNVSLEIGNEAVANHQFYKQSFFTLMIKTTVLRNWFAQIEERFLTDDNQPYQWSNPRRFISTLTALQEIAENPKATFTFVHLLEPHGPVQVDRNGNLLGGEGEGGWEPTYETYVDELLFVNDRYLETFDAILERSDTPPIIILQGDHGTVFGRVWTDDRRLTQFEVMNAWYIPGEKPEDLTVDLASINTFRVLFNTYFGTDYEQLEVRLYDIPKGYNAPFELVDVTDEFSD